MRTLVRELPTSRAQTKQVMKRRARSDTRNSFSKRGAHTCTVSRSLVRTQGIHQPNSVTLRKLMIFITHMRELNEIHDNSIHKLALYLWRNPAITLETRNCKITDTDKIYSIIASIRCHLSVRQATAQSSRQHTQNKKHQNVSCSKQRYDR